MAPKITVIIPVYNVEKYIEKCCRSLFGQTLENMEFIFVDDCSPDNSIAVMESTLRDYPQRESQVKVIRHDINRGVSTVRNTGTKAATGDYVIHCDGDDWVDPSMYEKMYAKALEKEADVVWSDFNLYYSDRCEIREQDFPEDGADCIRAMLSSRMHGAVWNKLVKRNLYADHDIRFPDGLNIFEDFVVSCQVFFFANTVAHIAEPLYFYNKTNESSLLTAKEKKISNTYQAIRNIENVACFFAEQQADGVYKKELAWCKLFAKTGFTRYREKLKEWRGIFRESNKYILSHPFLSGKEKIFQWCLAKKIWIVYDIRQLIGKINK